jgi:hypothetical protein
MEMFTKKGVANRWNCSTRKIDRLRKAGKLAWVDISGGLGSRPMVRFRVEDILVYEEHFLQSAVMI